MFTLGMTQMQRHNSTCLSDELEHRHLQDVAPHGYAIQLAQQVLYSSILVVLTEHQEGVPLCGQVLFRSQDLEKGQHPLGFFWKDQLEKLSCASNYHSYTKTPGRDTL